MSFEQMSFEQMAFEQMAFEQMAFEQMAFEQITRQESFSFQTYTSITQQKAITLHLRISGNFPCCL